MADLERWTICKHCYNSFVGDKCPNCGAYTNEMTFKQFRQWCNERACDGCWGYKEALLCIEVGSDILKLPFWKREKEWKKIKDRMLDAIINPINRKIQEVRGADNGSNI